MNHVWLYKVCSPDLRPDSTENLPQKKISMLDAKFEHTIYTV
jgi:hypothetical protein